MVAWHADSAIVMIANEKCQAQYFDISLACIRSQSLNEDMVPTMSLELSNFFTNQQSLLKLCCSKKPELGSNKYIQSDSFLLVIIIYEKFIFVTPFDKHFDELYVFSLIFLYFIFRI